MKRTSISYASGKDEKTLPTPEVVQIAKGFSVDGVLSMFGNISIPGSDRMDNLPKVHS